MSFMSSASQVSTYELCARKWAFQYIERLKLPPNKYAQFGTDTHGHLEAWLRSGTVPPADLPTGKVASAMIPHLPPHQAVNPDNVEIGLGMQLGGIAFRGFIDLWMPEWPGRPDWIPRVYDHKTTSGLQWALTPEDLPHDVQATLYSAWALLKSKSEKVSVQWTYGLTTAVSGKKTPQVLSVVCDDVTGSIISERLCKTIESAKEAMLIKESGDRAMDVPYEAKGCEAYGGCPFRERCNLSASQRMRSMMSQGNTKADFLAKLRANQAKHVSTSIETAAKLMDAPKTRPGRGESETKGTTLAAEVPKTSLGLGNRRVAPAAEAFTVPRRGLGNRRGAAAAQETPETPETTPETPETTPETPETTPETPETTPVAAPVEGTKKRWGRKNSATAAEEAPAENVKKTGWTLYVDCIPIKVGPFGVSLDDASAHIRSVMQAIEEEFGVPHYRMMEFGRGAGVFSAAMLRHLVENPPKEGVVLWTRSSESRDCLQSFMTQASVVVQG